MPAPLAAHDLRVEHLRDPLAIDETIPRFSWCVEGNGHDRMQSSYRIVVRDAGEVVWDSGEVESYETLNVEYGGRPLHPLTQYSWQVTVRDETGQLSEPTVATFGTGLLHRRWDAPWICVPPSKGAKPPEATLAYRNPFRALNVSNFRKEVLLPEGVKSARLYATALGTYRFFINGQRVGDDYLTPGFTNYHKRVEYNAYDVTSMLSEGPNAIGALLGEGWYAGFLGLDSKRPGALWGRKPQLSAFLLIELENGEHVCVETDQSWRHFIGGLIYSDMLKGEKFDSRMYPDGWDMPGFDDGEWDHAGADQGAQGIICANKAPPIRNTFQLTPKSVSRAPDGAWIFDIGQNMVGFCTARLRAKRDDVVRLVHAEMLDADGNLYLENLRTAVQEDIFVAREDGPFTYMPSFTFHGFRYVGVYGLDYEPKPDDLTGIVIHNDAPETSEFVCSEPLLNQLHSNILWGQRGNFVSVPMDCPQRDERLGWTADGQVFAPTAAYNMDIAAFFTKWLDDIVDEQTEEGAFPDVAPRANSTQDGAPAWGDAGVILPMLLHDRYADTRLLKRMYEPMKRWIEFIRRNNPDDIRENRNHNNYGDWLAIGQSTPNDMVATAYYAWLARLMRQAAEIMGIREDAAYYATLRDCISEAYQREYIRSDGTIGSGSQTSYLLSLFTGLVPDNLVGKAVQHLVDNIHSAGDRVQVGFLGVRHICPILTEYGHTELAYKLATSTEFPSWGYSIVNGATTIWERWDGWTKEHGFQVPNMNSFNHYAYGSVGEWMMGWMAGISPASPGCRELMLRPTPGGKVGYCLASYLSPVGMVRSEWRRDGQSVRYRFEIPANTRAYIQLLCEDDSTTHMNGRSIQPEIRTLYGTKRAVLQVGSGVKEVVVG
jgi:alpha-L-rhamnosidase